MMTRTWCSDSHANRLLLETKRVGYPDEWNRLGSKTALVELPKGVRANQEVRGGVVFEAGGRLCSIETAGGQRDVGNVKGGDGLNASLVEYVLAEEVESNGYPPMDGGIDSERIGHVVRKLALLAGGSSAEQRVSVSLIGEVEVRGDESTARHGDERFNPPGFPSPRS